MSGHCNHDALKTMEAELQEGYQEIEAIFDEIKVMSVATPDQEIRLGVDRVKVDKVLLVNAIQMRNKADDVDTHHSVSDGTEQSEKRSGMSSRHTSMTDTSSKIRDAKANAAARHIEIIALAEKAEQEEELEEIQRKLNRKKREIEYQRLSILLRAEQAKLQVYEDTQPSGVVGSKSPLYSAIDRTTAMPVSTPLCQKNAEIVERQMTETKSDVMLIAEAIATSVNANRIPVPEPCIFMGDPLEYPDWKVSFCALIENKGISDQEKIHHLKRYLGGPARKAVSGYFLLKGDAYNQAKNVLEMRYGSSFAITEAFRDKLDQWPRVQAKDAKSLRKLSDFLNQCSAAMTDIKGLEILNDNRENRKILKKLPDWIITRWSRIVARTKQDRSAYPSFAEFAHFIETEADIACDPIVSLESLRIVPKKERPGTNYKRNVKAATFATETDRYDKNKDTSQACTFCNKGGHRINECRTFGAKSAQEKQEFIRKRGMCYGCLLCGHITKNCPNRSKCNKCEKTHPTSLHRDKIPGEYKTEANNKSSNQDSTQRSEREAVCSKVSKLETENMSAMIVPVWVSSKNRPRDEHLVYALLDTQSDTTFVLESTADMLDNHPEIAKLRLSTMSTRDSTIECKKLNGLQIRGYNQCVY